MEIPHPQLNLIQDGSAGPLQAVFTIAVSIFSPLCAVKTVEDGHFSCRRFMSGTHHWKQKIEYVVTWVLQRDYFICSDTKERHSRLDCTLPRTLSFVVPSVTFVNIGRGTGAMNKPDNRR